MWWSWFTTPCEQQHLSIISASLQLNKETSAAIEKLLEGTGNKRINVVLENEPEKVDVNNDVTQDVNVAVTVDSTWQHRVHTSKFSAILWLFKFCHWTNYGVALLIWYKLIKWIEIWYIVVLI